MGTQTDDLRVWTQLRMRQRNLSHAQLALKCGLNRSTVTRFLGMDRRPTFDVAMRIVDALYDTTCIPLVDQVRDLVAGPERVEAALRSDVLLNPTDVNAIMSQYLERRAA